MWPKIEELRLILSTVEPDVACLTETWLTEDTDSDLIKANGYFCIRSDRSLKRGGGTAIYIRENMAFRTRNTHNVFNRCAEVTFVELTALNLAILCVYIPPSTFSADLDEIRDQLVLFSDNFLSEHSDNSVVILGDFNHFNTANLACDLYLADIVNCPTRGNNILDHILVSKELSSVYDSSCVAYKSPIGKADHKTLIATPHTAQSSGHVFRRHSVCDFRASNVANLMQKASEVDWNEVSKLDKIDDMWICLKTKILDLVNTCIPKKTVCLTSKDKSWITPLTKLLLNEKWEAYRLRNWPRYKHLQKKVKKEISKAKEIWAGKMKKSSYGLWKLTKQLSGRGNAQGSASLLRADESPQDAAEDIASAMCTNNSVNHQQMQRNFTNALTDWNISFSVWDIAKCLQKLPKDKACGSDGISNHIYALLGDFLAAPMKAIFEESVRIQDLPSEWKEGIVIPIPKTSPPQRDKLRMITLLPSPSKILERMVLNSVRHRLELLYGEDQHGFRKNCSTTTALLQITDTATRYYDELRVPAFSIMSLDLSKAFDRVDHSILLTKLQRVLPTRCTKWISNYLSNRSYRVKLRDYYSNRYNTMEGVPQGSVLGPALFCAMVGDFKCVSRRSNVTQYADDITIVTGFEISDSLEIKLALNKEMDNFTDWCKRNKQVHNPSKTQLLIYARSSSLSFSSLDLNLSPVMKILGVFLNRQLTWHDHVNEIYKKTSQRLRILRILRPHVSAMELHQVYVATVLSVFDYACQLFVGLETGLAMKMQKIDNRAHRIIFGKGERFCSCPPNSLKSRRETLSKDLLRKLIRQTKGRSTLFASLPQMLPRTGKLSNMYSRTERRRRSFFPFTTYLVNNDDY